MIQDTVTALMDVLLRRRLRKATRLEGVPMPGAVACWDCNRRHDLVGDARGKQQQATDFFWNHRGHRADWFERRGVAGLWIPNTNVTLGFQALQAFTVTNLHSLSSSTTTGWQSAVVDNTSNLYLDDHVVVKIDFANTTPGSSKAIFVYVYGGNESGVYTYPASGSEGTVTLSDITANPTAVKRIGAGPYLVQDAVMPFGPFSVGSAFGNVLPSYWGVVIMNQSGAAFAGSGNTCKHQGIYLIA